MRISPLALLFCLLPAPCLARTVELLGPLTVLPGQTVQTRVVVSEDVVGIAGGFINVTSEGESGENPDIRIRTAMGPFIKDGFHGDPVKPHGFSWIFLWEDRNGPGELLQVEITAAPKETSTDRVVPIRVDGLLKPAVGEFTERIDYLGGDLTIPGGVVGDADGSGTVNVKDVRRILLSLLEMETMTPANQYYADVWPLYGRGTPHGGDARISVQDAVTILKAVAGLVVLPTAEEIARGIVGDADGDGKVNIKDVMKVLRTLASLDTMTDGDRFRADVWPLNGDATSHGGDGKLTVQDAVTILKSLLGFEKLPGQENG